MQTEHPTPKDIFKADPFDPSVCVVDGYGLQLRVERGHLLAIDGIADTRRTRRFARVNHGLQRLVVVGHSGTVSLDALRWLDRVGVPFVHLDRDGAVLTMSAHAGLDDARLRRAQALAVDSDLGHGIMARLLDAKLAGQAHLAAGHLANLATAARIEDCRSRLPDATLTEARELEALAATAYFAAWSPRVALQWATKDRPRIPAHWERFDARRSPLRRGFGANHAADPINAMLNYLYALAEAECRLACLTLGLDPGLGLLHTDAKSRDSLALDLIEIVRPAVDAFVLDLVDNQVFRFSDFVELDDGHCRVLPPLTHRLAETLPRWHQAVGPWAEYIAHALAEVSPHPIRKATPLTGRTRRRVATASSAPRRKGTLRPAALAVSAPSSKAPFGRVCRDCGTRIASKDGVYCPQCWPARRAAGLQKAVSASRAALEGEHGRSQRGRALSDGKARAGIERIKDHGWEPDAWELRLAPHVGTLTLKQLTSATGLSVSHASRIKRGVQRPHPRHWRVIAELVGASALLEAPNELHQTDAE